ncbi:N-6 DNA methylase [Vibrio mimicus]|nr:N-6 DNA methylase [Vibrio mimicus]EKF9206605.1 N-6 DNA methylase [Vibrio cholerae]AMG01920.1 SAM-dependent methyltransferase [Vibrio mimicus]EKF9434809.1 N-6 DNA methylase [Vibrio cholerae]EKF9627683.1 N-6 DNA methylase [Vibrio cholerae]EKF9645910.1 N-6 DNA methylase [Vibrio cholerae]
MLNPHPLSKKRELGAYYTPPELSQVLTDWAIVRSDEEILEPSFGGCGFFDSSIKTLRRLGCKSPEKQLYGVDIDGHAFSILSEKFGHMVETSNRFIQNDFISVQPSDFSVNEFDVVLGNPPYVSMHNMTEKQREACEKVLHNSPFSGLTMGRNASLWAFFLLHSLSFIKEGGRVAWVLPSSLLHADYAKRLLAIHKRHFYSVKVLKLAERFFKEEGAQETSVILIAEGFSAEPMENSHFSVASVENVIELKQAIETQLQATESGVDGYKLDIVSREARKAYFDLMNSESSKPIGHYADIKIGMVTGANKYFIVDKKTIEKFGLPEDVLQPAIGKFSFFSGITHDMRKHKKLQCDGYRAYLVCPTEEHMQNPEHPVSIYLNQITQQERNKNRTFAKRPHWFAPGYGIDGIIADCFLSYMIHLGPRMVVNKAKLNCTNSIHKVIFREKTSALVKQAFATTLLSTYSQFSAEIEGRAYSSGVLKIEPSAGRNIKVLFTNNCVEDLVAIKTDVERELQEGDHKMATELVDDVLIKHGLITMEQCKRLSSGIRALRSERYKGVRIFP